MPRNQTRFYLGRAKKDDGTTVYLEAVNGGPFRTVEGARRSLQVYKNIPGYSCIHIVPLDVDDENDTPL